jgi:tryptophan-rich sensory protein
VVLLGLLVLCLLVGMGAARSTNGAVAGWYDGLMHPPLSPPDWLFGPVWAVLYVLMAVAAWLAWRAPPGGKAGVAALAWWGGQLAVNALWSPVFFGLRLVGPALGVIVVLVGAVAATSWAFWRLDRMAAYLLFPYLAWLGFASYLNAGFWWLNHG